MTRLWWTATTAGELVAIHVGKWLYRMVNTQRPLEEKMALFLHHIFPVAWGKSEHGPSIYRQIDMFRNVAMTDMRTILLELSRDPAMIFWLDNNENHKNEINENYGRELLDCSPWAWATTPKTTSRTPRAPSPAGRSGSRCLSTLSATTLPSSSSCPKITTTGPRRFSAKAAISTATTSSTSS